MKQCIRLKAQTRAKTYVDQTRCLKKFDFQDMVFLKEITKKIN
jgi:hypothetical protein